MQHTCQYMHDAWCYNSYVWLMLAYLWCILLFMQRYKCNHTYNVIVKFDKCKKGPIDIKCSLYTLEWYDTSTLCQHEWTLWGGEVPPVVQGYSQEWYSGQIFLQVYLASVYKCSSLSNALYALQINTSLMLASMDGHHKVVELLIRARASVNCWSKASINSIYIDLSLRYSSSALHNVHWVVKLLHISEPKNSSPLG